MSDQTLASPTNGHGHGGANSTNGAHATALDLPATSRSRIAAAEIEEADVILSLGEFNGVPSLSHSETRLLIQAIQQQREKDAGGRKLGETDTLHKTMDYLSIFARFKTREAIMAVERLLTGMGLRLEGFERSQLATLCPTNGDEAFTLIPSLKPKFSEAEMDEITRQIADLRTFE